MHCGTELAAHPLTSKDANVMPKKAQFVMVCLDLKTVAMASTHRLKDAIIKMLKLSFIFYDIIDLIRCCETKDFFSLFPSIESAKVVIFAAEEKVDLATLQCIIFALLPS